MQDGGREATGGKGEPLPRDLLVRAGRGDTAAFHRFYLLTVDDVVRFVSSRVPVDAVDDVVAETYLRAFRSAAGFQDRGVPAVAWLLTIARNQIASHFRVASRTPAPRADERTMIATDERVVQQDEEAGVVGDLAALPERYRRVLTLRFIDDRSVADCGEELGLNEGAVRALTFRALEALRQQLRADQR